MNNTRRSIAAASELEEHPLLSALRDVQPDELSQKAALKKTVSVEEADITPWKKP